MKNGQVPVSERALVARVNRVLVKREEILKRCARSSRWHGELGDYYIIDFNHNVILKKDVALEEIATELKALKAWEKLTVLDRVQEAE